jgi:putative transcriptional regulator
MDKLHMHPEDELLASYAAGSLPLSQALCISVHLEHCSKCSQNLHRLNQLGSELMLKLQPAPPSPELKNKIFDQIDQMSIDEISNKIATPHTEAINPLIPRCLHQFIKTGYTDLKWKRLSRDIQSYELCRDQNNAKVELLRIKAGGTSGTHTHMGDEYTVILEGSFSDESGLYRQGDFLVRDSRDKHTPVATIDKECICLAVTEAPIQLTGFFGRLLNPLIRRSYA